MIVIHAAVFAGQSVIWGESPTGTRVRTRSGKQTIRKSDRQRRYPFDAGLEGLSQALTESSLDFTDARKRQTDVLAWLPTQADSPIPSSPLIADPKKSKAKIRIEPWAISIYPLAAEEAVDLFCVCADRRTLAPGVVLGADLTFWVDALRFAGSLVARQKYLPGIRTEGNQFRAQWNPVFSGNDAKRLTDMAKRMPAAARLLSELGATEPPVSSAVDCLKDFVTTCADYLIRSASFVDERRARPRKTSGFDSVHSAWLHALTAEDAIIPGDPAELAGLSHQIREWSSPITIQTSSPFRLCFRIEEPDEAPPSGPGRARIATGSWYVRYLLQGVDDPSLQIPLKDFWKSGEKSSSLWKAQRPQIQQYVLSSLGQAARLCPRIVASLKRAEPIGYPLDAAGAHEFLKEKAATLEAAGFTVMLPAWWSRKGAKVRLAVRANVKSPQMQSKGRLSLGEIVQFDWEVAIGGEKLSLKELEALADMKVPLVRLRGQWVELNAKEIQAAIDFWKKTAAHASVRDIVQMALGAREAPRGLQFGGVKATGWVGRLIKDLKGSAALKELSAPEAFVGTLRPYQVRGYSWLSFLSQWGLGACLADDMGLGKTVQTLALIQRDWESNGKRPVLLVCPTTVVNNWQKEAARFTPHMPVMVHHGIGRAKGKEFKERVLQHAIVLSSYGLLHRDLKVLGEVSWSAVILDEAQNIKNSDTQQARAARSLNSDYRIALTGTPVENNVGDLWSIMEFLNPGFLGTQAEFKRTFFVPIQAERDPAASERLKRITGPFILRRVKTDKSIISDLPEKMEMKVFCPLTKEQTTLYAAIVREIDRALESSEGIQRKGLVLATLSKLKQVCNHPAHFLGDNSAIPGRSGKLARLTEMVEEIIETGDRALVFTQFAEMGNILQKHFQETLGREILFLHGGTTRIQRDRMVEKFQNGPSGPPLFILSLKAGGTGLNLTAANHVFHFDRWWNPAVENQATDRAFRIGQTRNVQVHKFVCVGTLEEKIDEMIELKREISDNVIAAGEGWITELSNKDLREIWALRKEALGQP